MAYMYLHDFLSKHYQKNLGISERFFIFNSKHPKPTMTQSV